MCPKYLSVAEDNIIAARVDLGPQHFNIDDATLPEAPEQVADKYMLNNALSEGRISGVQIAFDLTHPLLRPKIRCPAL